MGFKTSTGMQTAFLRFTIAYDDFCGRWGLLALSMVCQVHLRLNVGRSPLPQKERYVSLPPLHL